MAIAEQFAGLRMDQLIGGPLSAAADASTQLANSTADFINSVGFDNTGKVRTVAFAYQKRSANEDGTSNLDEMKVDVPLLAIVPIPNLQVDEVNILFDMEVKQSEKQESSLDVGASLSGSARIGLIKINVSGSVSAHQSNTRSSDNSAKYHVDVRATNHGTPEGLARVLDMMAANVAPALVGSTLKDGNGQTLSEQARVKAERLRALRQDISQIESRLNAARQGLDTHIGQLKKLATTQMNVYQGEMTRTIGKLDDDKKENAATIEKYNQAMEEVSQSWNKFQNQAADLVKLVKDSKDDGTQADGVSDLFGLKALKDNASDKYASGESCYDAISASQKKAVEAQKKVDDIEDELFKKKAEYSDAIAGKNTVTP